MALYGAPIWAGDLNARTRTLLRRPQRVMAVRCARAYRTVSHEAACVMAGTPPWDLEAEVLASVYRRRAEARARGADPCPEEMQRLRIALRRRLLRRWRERLEDPAFGRLTIAAIRPVLKGWLEREHGAMTFRLAQVLSGHGCFGRYLCNVAGREPSTECHHCGGPEDTSRHTLAECPAWAAQRAELVAVVGADLSLPTVVKAMVGSETSWMAVVSFCEDVISQKEAAEREREDDPSSQPLRRRRIGRRRAAHNRLLPP